MPGLAELVQLAHEKNLWMIDDIGSGALGPGRPPHVGDEPTAAAGIAAGADLVLFSGDKLLGGPQCGIMAGTAQAVGRVESDPLMRALRLDKMTLAALEATLLLACDPDRAAGRIPLWSMIATPLDALSERATKLAAIFRSELGLNAAAVPAESYLGGGSAPVQPIPSVAVAVSPPFPIGLRFGSRAGPGLAAGEPARGRLASRKGLCFSTCEPSPKIATRFCSTPFAKSVMIGRLWPGPTGRRSPNDHGRQPGS